MMNDNSNRRQFLRVIGGIGITSMSAPNYLIGAKPSAALSRSGVLLETFCKCRGWKVDTQHYLQMGGNYLLAHGMGNLLRMLRQPLICLLRVNGIFGFFVTGVRGTGSHPAFSGV